MDTKRLNKYLSELGLCSRREADQWILAGRVSVNGQRAQMGQKISETDEVTVDGKKVRAKRPKSLLIALNKPRGIVCTTDRSEPANIVDYLGLDERIFPIGRLDKDSEGLILLTNEGALVNRILRARYGHEKEYLVETKDVFDEAFLREMASGVKILGQWTKPCRVKRTGPKRFRIILTQGLNRQIRRMTEALGHEVTMLRRIRIMNITLGSLPVGHYRELGYKERAQLEGLLKQAEKRIDGSADEAFEGEEA